MKNLIQYTIEPIAGSIDQKIALSRYTVVRITGDLLVSITTDTADKEVRLYGAGTFVIHNINTDKKYLDGPYTACTEVPHNGEDGWYGEYLDISLMDTLSMGRFRRVAFNNPGKTVRIKRQTQPHSTRVGHGYWLNYGVKNGN